MSLHFSNDFSLTLELMLQNLIPYIVEDFHNQQYELLHYAAGLIPCALFWCAISFNALFQMWHDILQKLILAVNCATISCLL